MSSSTVVSVVLGVIVLVLLIWRQLVVRRLREGYQLSIVLAIIGIIDFADFLRGHPHNTGGILAAVVGSLILAAVLGVVRALTVKVWRGEDGQLLRQGNWLTAALWVVAIAAHLGYDYLVAGHSTGSTGTNVGDATILLYLVVSLTVQRFVMLNRAARLEAAGQLAGSGPQVPLA